MDNKKNYYEILDLDKSATTEEIKSAFKLLAKKYHPDINRNPEAIAKFKEINEAYSVLKDAELKKEYDKYSSVKIKKGENKNHCNYYTCQKEVHTFECDFCAHYFCSEHIIPHPPYSFWDRINFGIPDNIHPCPDCPPCPSCKNKYHREPYVNPYKERDKETTEPKPPKEPPKPTINQIIIGALQIIETQFTLDYQEIETVKTINPKLSHKDIGSKIVKFISEKSISTVKRNPDSKGLVLESMDILKKELGKLSNEIFDSATLSHLDGARNTIVHITKPSPPVPGPKPNDPKIFVKQVFDPPFDIPFNKNIYSSLQNLRKEILQNDIEENEIRRILNALIIILKDSSFEKKLDNSCYKFIKKIYEKYAIDMFSYWNQIYNKSTGKKEESDLDQFPQLCPKCKTYSVIPIVYGLPTNHALELEKQGKVWLAGCITRQNDPQYWCTYCKKKIHKPEEKLPKYIKKQVHKDEKIFTITYTYKTIREAESIFNSSKITKTNILEKIDVSKKIFNIESNENSVTFYYKEKKSINKKIKVVVLIFVSILVILSLLIYASFSTIRYGEVKNITSTKAITSKQDVSNKISFSEYTNDVYASENKQVTLNGFLKRSIEENNNAGVHIFSIVDDYANAIVLNWEYTELKKYLPDVGTTKELYSVKGVFKREYKTLKFNVESISSYQREPVKQVDVTNVVSYTEQITVNRTSPKYPLIRNLVFKLIGKEVLCDDGTKINSCSNEKPLYCSLNGLKEEPTKCGCSSGKRVYKDECIPEVKCSDNTFEPECSINKPKQCVNRKLIDNPELCGCPNDYKLKDKKCVYIKCSDGTIEPDCSPKLKMQCMEGSFVYNPNKCGCPEGYVERKDTCVKTCSDGIAYDECSSNKPNYCSDGQLINRATVCGCQNDYIIDGENCISKYMVQPRETQLNYVLRGNHGELRYTVYGGMNNYLSNLPRSISYFQDENPPTSKDFIMRYLDNEKQKSFIEPLVNVIKETTSNQDDQARIAISIVQNIPYDYVGLDTGSISGKYPYEVLYTNTGVCSEKAGLLAYLLRDLGYGAAIFRFNVENHDAVGIKCPSQYSYINSGYCFIESTTPDIITYSDGNYVRAGKLTSTPEIIKISDGDSFDSVSEEYQDAQEYKQIIGMGTVLTTQYYNLWLGLVNKYGMKTSS